MPVGQAQVHDHESEVVSKRICDEEPFARKILEPYLRLCGFVVSVYQCESSVFDLAVDIECAYVFAAARITKNMALTSLHFGHLPRQRNRRLLDWRT